MTPLSPDEIAALREAVAESEARGYRTVVVLRGDLARLLVTLDAAQPDTRLDEELLARAVDAHNEQEEPFSPVHCNSGDDCHLAIAREYAALGDKP